MAIPFADNFLAGSLLSLLLPVGLLIAIAVWYVLSVKRIPHASETSATLPAPDVVTAAQDRPADPPTARGA
jgi:hypothetical protein